MRSKNGQTPDTDSQSDRLTPPHGFDLRLLEQTARPEPEPTVIIPESLLSQLRESTRELPRRYSEADLARALETVQKIFDRNRAAGPGGGARRIGKRA